MEEILKDLHSSKHIMKDIHRERNGMCCTTSINNTEDLGEQINLLHF